VINVETIQLPKKYLVPAPTYHSILPNNGKSRVIKTNINYRSNVTILHSLSLTEFQNMFFYRYTEQEVISGLTLPSAGHLMEGCAAFSAHNMVWATLGSANRGARG